MQREEEREGERERESQREREGKGERKGWGVQRKVEGVKAEEGGREYRNKERLGESKKNISDEPHAEVF